jgi:hypothetical protein
LSANAKNVDAAEKYYKRVIEINPQYTNAKSSCNEVRE